MNSKTENMSGHDERIYAAGDGKTARPEARRTRPARRKALSFILMITLLIGTMIPSSAMADSQIGGGRTQ
jgi:hypothetical protein